MLGKYEAQLITETDNLELESLPIAIKVVGVTVYESEETPA